MARHRKEDGWETDRSNRLRGSAARGAERDRAEHILLSNPFATGFSPLLPSKAFARESDIEAVRYMGRNAGSAGQSSSRETTRGSVEDLSLEPAAHRYVRLLDR